MHTKIQDSFEYLAEQAKLNFQGYMNGLLEFHADFLHKISKAKENKKSGIWIELSEAELLSSHMLECVTNTMASYTILNNTNKFLNTNYKAARSLLNKDLETSIDAFIKGDIDKEKLAYHFNQFVNVRKPGVAT